MSVRCKPVTTPTIGFARSTTVWCNSDVWNSSDAKLRLRCVVITQICVISPHTHKHNTHRQSDASEYTHFHTLDIYAGVKIFSKSASRPCVRPETEYRWKTTHWCWSWRLYEVVQSETQAICATRERRCQTPVTDTTKTYPCRGMTQICRKYEKDNGLPENSIKDRTLRRFETRVFPPTPT